LQCCGTETGTAGTFCPTGTGMHYDFGSGTGFGTGFGSGSKIKWNKKIKTSKRQK